MAIPAPGSEDPTAAFTEAERKRFEKIDPSDQRILVSILMNGDAANLDEAVHRLAVLANWPVE